ncbi:MAG TPA: CpsB/CapC family capsule biosynthesis tyrosine phosphatase [Thermoleophilaceae bacterium]|nr:CpsB/CapC family capsule biosynthesis tyrosine phosphatase [Thermoleophilaceae bacterium]
MIDLHSHILPGLDDGARTPEDSLAMARVAAAGGIRTIAGTPHIRDDHSFPLPQILEALQAARDAIDAAGVPMEVVAAGEISVSKLADLRDEDLSALALGDGPVLLVESPYTRAAIDMDTAVSDLRVRGFTTLLAHPERSPMFQADPKLLARLVARGAMCSVTSASMAGRFGRTAQDFTARLFAEGLVHDVASDAHDAEGRPPLLLDGFAALDERMRGLLAQARWFTAEAPAAILAGEASLSPPRPPDGGGRRGRFRRR